jgi:hypothetical protein
MRLDLEFSLIVIAERVNTRDLAAANSGLVNVSTRENARWRTKVELIGIMQKNAWPFGALAAFLLSCNDIKMQC